MWNHGLYFQQKKLLLSYNNEFWYHVNHSLPRFTTEESPKNLEIDLDAPEAEAEETIKARQPETLTTIPEVAKEKETDDSGQCSEQSGCDDEIQEDEIQDPETDGDQDEDDADDQEVEEEQAVESDADDQEDRVESSTSSDDDEEPEDKKKRKNIGSNKSRRHDRPTLSEVSKSTWSQLKIYNNKRYVAWKTTNQRRLATYLRRDPYVCVLAHMPNKTDTFHYYQRLKELERPVSNLLLGPYQNTIAPTPYVGQTNTFYRFVTEDHNGEPFWYFVHKNGYLPDPVSTKVPKERKMDGFLKRVFPQFRN